MSLYMPKMLEYGSWCHKSELKCVGVPELPTLQGNCLGKGCANPPPFSQSFLVVPVRYTNFSRSGHVYTPLLDHKLYSCLHLSWYLCLKLYVNVRALPLFITIMVRLFSTLHHHQHDGLYTALRHNPLGKTFAGSNSFNADAYRHPCH